MGGLFCRSNRGATAPRKATLFWRGGRNKSPRRSPSFRRAAGCPSPAAGKRPARIVFARSAAAPPAIDDAARLTLDPVAVPNRHCRQNDTDGRWHALKKIRGFPILTFFSERPPRHQPPIQVH